MSDPRIVVFKVLTGTYALDDAISKLKVKPTMALPWLKYQGEHVSRLD